MDFVNSQNNSDLNSILKAALSGSKESEEELFRNLSARFGYIVRQKIRSIEDGKEILQNALASILANYRETDFTVSFAAWAYRILQNKINDYYRHREVIRKTFNDSGVLAERQVGESDPDLKRKLIGCLQKVNGINKRHARILILNYQGYDSDEICRRLGISKGNYYTILSRARVMLEKCLKGED